MKILIHISVAVGSEKCSATLDFGVLFPKLTHDVEYERYGRASGKCSFHLHHEGHCFPVPVRCVALRFVTINQTHYHVVVTSQTTRPVDHTDHCICCHFPFALYSQHCSFPKTPSKT